MTPIRIVTFKVVLLEGIVENQRFYLLEIVSQFIECNY